MKDEFIYGLILGIIISVLIISYIELSTPRRIDLKPISPKAAKNKYCSILVNEDCNVSTNSILIENYDANKNGKLEIGGISNPWNPDNDCGVEATSGDNLATLCLCYYGIKTDDECKKLCGCS